MNDFNDTQELEYLSSGNFDGTQELEHSINLSETQTGIASCSSLDGTQELQYSTNLSLSEDSSSDENFNSQIQMGIQIGVSVENAV